MLTAPVRRLALLLSVLATTLVTTVAGSVPGPAYAADPGLIILDVPNLPTGPNPSIPYLDVPGKRIVDGGKHVSVTGLKGSVVQLHKVDGGYVLARPQAFGRMGDLVFVSSAGKRTLITTQWKTMDCDCLRKDVVVDSAGSSVTFNRHTKSGYVDTLTVSLPSLKIIRKRAFTSAPRLFEQRGGLVTLALDTRLLRYAPRTSKVTTYSSGHYVSAADGSAGQQAYRTGQASDQTVAPLPGSTRTPWSLDDDANISSWSADGELLAGTSEVLGTDRVFDYIIWRASDGSSPLIVHTPGTLDVIWESSSTFLIESTRGQAAPDEDPEGRWQLVRCSTSGACEKVGPETYDPYAGFIVATRRSN